MPDKLLSLQYLRAVAAIMVIVFHGLLFSSRLGYPITGLEWTASGVDIFFVVSGFVMLVSIRPRLNSRQIRPLDFYWRRIVRIVPLYWLMTSVKLSILVLLPSLVNNGHFDLGHTLASYLFIPALNPVTGATQPLLEPGWTLNYEMFFYGIFGGLLFLPRRRLVPAIVALIVALPLSRQILPGGGVVLEFYRDSIIVEFTFGVLLAEAYMRGWIVPAPLAFLMMPLGFFLIAGNWIAAGPSALSVGLPAAMILAAAVSLERVGYMVNLRFIGLLGDASYSLYLSHSLVLSACSTVALKLELDRDHLAPAIFAAVVTFGAVLACGILLHRSLERPLVKFLHRRWVI